jgi:uncharacterized protein (TIGR03435 family)
LFALGIAGWCQGVKAPGAESFEVSSIRLVQPYTDAELKTGAGNEPLGAFPADRFIARHVPMDFLVSVAFKVDLRHVVTSEKWQDEQLYDVAATVPGNQQLTLDQMTPLLRTLLGQRFHLVTHAEERVVSGYVLMVGKSKPKLQTAATGANSQAQILSDRFWGRGIGTDMLASVFERLAGGPVRDMTGLKGKYDVDLRYHPINDTDSSLPDFFTAVQEQLGLKLVPAKVPIQYLVVDHVDRMPTEN